MWNEAIIIGNLGRDPEIRNTNNGSKVATLSLATSQRWKDKNSGEAKERTEWHRVVCFGRLAEVAEKFCKKGTMLAVRGSIRTRKWTDSAGAEKYSTEIVVDGFDSKLKILKDGKDNRTETTAASTATTAPADNDGDLDDDIPF